MNRTFTVKTQELKDKDIIVESCKRCNFSTGLGGNCYHCELLGENVYVCGNSDIAQECKLDFTLNFDVNQNVKNNSFEVYNTFTNTVMCVFNYLEGCYTVNEAKDLAYTECERLEYKKELKE